MAQEPLIVCDGLVKIHKTAELETVALQGLDLIVAPGEMLGVVGPSGSGKTTLLNILGGLDRPSAGRVWVDGQDLLGLSDSALNRYRRSKVGFVWQQSSRNLVPYLTAIKNVELPMILAGRSDTSNRHRAEELLESVGLAERRHHRLAQMSGGEQQRVAIAVALANDPGLLLADEPTGEVDTATALAIYATLRKLNRDHGLTTVIVSHDQDLAHHVHRVVAIRDGKTSTETTRHPSRDGSGEAQESVDKDAGERAQGDLEELVVLDSAGRLQVPRELLEHFSIRSRARVELAEEGILIRPVAVPDGVQSTEMLIADLAPQHGVPGWRGQRFFATVEATGRRVSAWAASLRNLAGRVRGGKHDSLRSSTSTREDSDGPTG